MSFNDRTSIWNSKAREEAFKLWFETNFNIQLRRSGLEESGIDRPDLLAVINGKKIYFDVKRDTISKPALDKYLKLAKTENVTVICVKEYFGRWVGAKIEIIDKYKGPLFPGNTSDSTKYSGQSYYRPLEKIWTPFKKTL